MVRKWGARSYVLRDVNLEIKEGEFVSIMGPSGSGKSTLLHILGLLDDPSDGDYVFLDEPVKALGEKRRAELQKRHIGFVFQSYHLIDDLTVYENLEGPLIYKEMKSSERQSLVSDMLDRFQIVGKKDLFSAQLSGGQQQLVGIARCIITSPKLVLADEPTCNLNSSQGEEIMNFFKRLNAEGMTIVQVTHAEKTLRVARASSICSTDASRHERYFLLRNAPLFPFLLEYRQIRKCALRSIS